MGSHRHTGPMHVEAYSRHSRGSLGFLLVAAALIGCEQPAYTPLAPAATPRLSAESAQGVGLRVSAMTRNVYIGTNIGAVLTAPAAEVPVRVAIAFAEVVASNPAERMARLADEIAARGPDFVGLQEVSTFLIQDPGDFLIGNPQQATTVVFDYLELLLAELQARGVRYQVASQILNVDVELPAARSATSFFDLRVQDRDVVLVRQGIPWGNPASGLYATAIPVTIGPISFDFTRGWAAVDARVRGVPIRFLTTHLETQPAAGGAVNVAQGLELLAILSGSPLPFVLAGDLNSAANEDAPAGSKTATYGNLLAAGLHDLWASVHPAQTGLTCCHADDLRNTQVEFDQRLDFVFFGPGFRGADSAEVVGDELGDRTASGLWPSDHAGVFGQIRLR